MISVQISSLKSSNKYEVWISLKHQVLEITMMLSQSALGTESTFLMQFSPSGSLHTQMSSKFKFNRNEQNNIEIQSKKLTDSQGKCFLS